METQSERVHWVELPTQRFFGSGINGNPLSKPHRKNKPAQRFFGSGINGNGFGAVCEFENPTLNASSEVELMETRVFKVHKL